LFVYADITLTVINAASFGHMDTTRNKPSQHEHSNKEHPSPKSKRDGQADSLAVQYNYYYDRIYPFLKEGKLDFPRLAAKTGLKERRIRETLLFRLSTGEVMQLFGRKDGFCYICGYKSHSPANKEPVCISCLKSLDTAIQEAHLAGISLQSKKQTVTESPGLPEAAELPAFQSNVPPAEPDPMMKELERYRQMFGPLPSQEVPAAASGELEEMLLALPESDDSATDEVSPENVNDETGSEEISEPKETMEYVAEVDPLLKMLALDDSDVPFVGLEMPVADLFSKVSIRHFGFQRTKGG
jgi:hypothetical protein